MSDKRKTTRKKRTGHYLEKKLSIIHNKMKNERKTLDDLATKYGCERSTVSKILKRRNEIIKINELTPNKSRIRNQKGEIYLVEQALLKWFLSARAKNLPISQVILQSKAVEFFILFQKNPQIKLPPKFEASRGWLTRFQERNNLSFKTEIGKKVHLSTKMLYPGQD